jgi:heptosyltransferase-1
MGHRYSPSHLRSIVVVFPSRIGNTIQAMPFLRALRSHFSRSWITLIVKKPQADLLRHHGTYDDLVVIRGNSALEIIRVASIIRRRRYDLSIDLGGLLKGGLITFLGGARRRLGYNFGDSMDGVWVASNQKIPPLRVRNNIDRYLAFSRHLGAIEKDRQYGLEVLPEEREAAHRILRDRGVDLDLPACGLILDSSRVRKLWPGEDWMKLGRLLAGVGYQVLLISNHPEEVVVNGNLPEGCFDLCTMLNLITLPPAFQACDFIVGSDTGPLHVASASGARTYALFGPTDYRRYMPMTPGSCVIQRNRALGCLRRSRRIPCLRCAMGRGCMRRIRPEDVFESIRRRERLPG